ncbi:helix-turn-helix domain-containing protein [Pseudomonas sp. TE24901]
MDKIGMRLKEERARLNYTQQRFAAIGGVLANAHSKYERGERSPSALYLAQLAQVGVDVLYVLTGQRLSRAEDSDFGVAFNGLPARERRVIAELVECITRRA